MTDNHNRRYASPSGTPVLRISEVIKTLAKEQLVFWANMLGWKHIRYQDELDRTANIGTFAHGVIEQYYNKREICIYDYESYGIYRFSDKNEAYNAAKSFFKWLRKNERFYKVLETECTLVNEDVGGTIDCIIECPNDPDKVILVDYKTSTKIHFTQFLQLAGYLMLYESVNGRNSVAGAMVMRLDKKHGQKAEAKFISYEDMIPYVECFKSLMTVAYLSKALETNMHNDMKDFISIMTTAGD